MKRVYFMKPIGMSEPVKVGCSKMPRHRLKALDIWSPFPLEIIADVPAEHRDEGNVHWHLRAERLHGEWFRSSPKLLSLIAFVTKNGFLPPLEDKPCRTNAGRGSNPTRNPEWKLAKCKLTSRISRAERHAFGYWRRLERPQRIDDLIASYQGPFTPPPSAEMAAEIDAYIGDLCSRPKDTRSWKEWYAEQNRELREKSYRAQVSADREKRSMIPSQQTAGETGAERGEADNRADRLNAYSLHCGRFITR